MCFTSSKSHKAIWDGSVILLNLGTAKTLNLLFSVIGRKVAETLDLLQVDLLASGASLFWPRSGRPRATKSRELPRHMKSDEGLFWKSTETCGTFLCWDHAVLAFRENVDISLTVFLLCFLPKISAVHLRKGPSYEQHHVPRITHFQPNAF